MQNKPKKRLKILNLYAGIGGNRKLWGDEHDITAVENNPKIAAVYKKFFPKDKVIVGDAHKYLLEHFYKFDFIWSSPPCPTHSRARFPVALNNLDGSKKNKQRPVYPDMTLYQEIILLDSYCPKRIKWVVENVRSYYDPLIKPFEVQRHYFWSNFVITKKQINRKISHQDIKGSDEIHGFDISKEDLENKRLALRNMVDPELSLHIFRLAFKNKQDLLF